MNNVEQDFAKEYEYYVMNICSAVADLTSDYISEAFDAMTADRDIDVSVVSEDYMTYHMDGFKVKLYDQLKPRINELFSLIFVVKSLTEGPQNHPEFKENLNDLISSALKQPQNPPSSSEDESPQH